MPPRSRHTRHQDAASRSRQGHIIDLDPTDGLPVQKYGLQKVIINQDASTNLSSTNPKSTSSAEWAGQFNTDQHPWPEPPLPSYFADLSPWNQEMLRKARAGNTNRIVSTWDRKNNSWISGAEQERKAATLKANALNNNNNTDSTEKPQNGNDANSQKSDDESGAEDSSNEHNQSADESDGDETAPFKPSTKRRKVTSRNHGTDDTRTFEVTRWVALPPSQADKVPERTYLAPRRPGMPPLYAPEYAQKMFGQYHSSATLTGTSGYDLGEGGGLSNASGVLAAGSTNDGGTATPRKNIPPRRKKKKLGGPGRKKANPAPGTIDGVENNQQNVAGGAAAGQDGGNGTDAMEGVLGEDGQPVGDTSGNTFRNPGYDGTNDDATAQDDGDNDNDNDNDNDESGSEAEGSEEGEIDESGGVVGTANEQVQEQEREPEVVMEIEPQSLPLPTVEVTAVEPISLPVPPTITEPEPEQILDPEPEPEPILEATTVTEIEPEIETIPTPAPEHIEVKSPSPPPQSPTAPTPSPPSPIPATIEESAVPASPTAQPIVTVTASDTATVEEQEEKEKEDEDAADVGAAPAEEGAEVDFLGVMDAAIDREVSEGA